MDSETKLEVGSIQKLPERLNTVEDAATLLMVIASIAIAAWLLGHAGQKGVCASRRDRGLISAWGYFSFRRGSSLAMHCENSAASDTSDATGDCVFKRDTP